MCHRHLNSQFSILNSQFQNRRPRPSGTPCSAGPPSTISTTPPSPLLGGAAERNFDHPSQPPL